MISDQGIHADIDHAHALIKFAEDQGLSKVFVHGITDGRDVPPKSAGPFVESVKYHLATLIGRFYAMDRDGNLERTQKAYDLMVNGQGEKVEDANEAVQAAYNGGLESDYYMEPVLLKEEGLIKPEDVVVFFNFRTDRAQQLTAKLIDELGVKMVVFGAYTEKAPNVFPPQTVKQNIGSIVSKKGLKQLRIAETEKFPHVTFFFNSQDKEPYEGEDRIVVQSPKVASYKDSPEMSAPEITEKLLAAMDDDYAFIVLNFANLDLVGHSGDFDATVKAIETIDECLSQVIPKALEKGYVSFITGDHGNAEYMMYDDGSPCPSHTRNPVPFIAVGEDLSFKNPSQSEATGGLQDIAPTILHVMGYQKPEVMTGHDLLA
jgi:2,3-bisphosphoglycerate-independent phosphoglycerate mutase